MFDPNEIGFIRAIAPSLGEGAKRALLLGEAMDPEGPEAPGLVVLSADWELESSTPGVERWLSDLPDGDWDAGRLPTAVLAVAGNTRPESDAACRLHDGVVCGFGRAVADAEDEEHQQDRRRHVASASADPSGRAYYRSDRRTLGACRSAPNAGRTTPMSRGSAWPAVRR